MVVGVGALVFITGFMGLRYVQRRFAARSCCAPVHEAKANLKALYVTERAFLQEKDAYSEDMSRIGFEPELRNRYTYFTAMSGHVLSVKERRSSSFPAGAPRPSYQIVAADPEARKFRGSFTTFAQTTCPLTLAILPDGTRAGLGVTSRGNTDPGVFIGAAVANIDDDPTPDCWSIATVERVAANGYRISEGEPYNELNDMEY